MGLPQFTHLACGGFRRVQREGVSGYDGQCPRRSRKKATGVGIILNANVDDLHDSVQVPVNVDLAEGEDAVGR